MNNDFFDNNSGSFGDEPYDVTLVTDEDSYDPVGFENLPKSFQEDIKDLAAELIDPDRRKAGVMGCPMTGKSFMVNNLIDSMESFLEQRNFDPMVFIRITSEDVNKISNMPGSFKNYMSYLTTVFGKYEENFCFVAVDPGVVSKVLSEFKKSRVIFEVSHSTLHVLMEMETSGATRMWSDWTLADMDRIEVSKKEMIDLLFVAMNIKMKETFGVNLDVNLVKKIVDVTEKMSSDVFDEDGYSKVPFGVWSHIVRRVCGTIGLSSDEKVKAYSPSAIKKIIEKVVTSKMAEIKDFTEDEKEFNIFISKGNGGDVFSLPPELVKMMTAEADDEDEDEQEKVSPFVFNDISKLEESIKKEIFGQDEAITNVVEGLFVPAAGIHDKEKPLRSLLFLGPTGTGKTAVAQLIAEHVGTKKMNLVRIDMSEYAKEHEASKLIGAPPGYAGFDKGGYLTEAVKKHPHSLILLDEIEKAHPKVWESFLQVLDAGRLTDGTGNTVDFTQTIIVMTSNIGASELAKKSIGFSSGTHDEQRAERNSNAKSIIKKALEGIFTPELINRIDEQVIFNEISLDVAKKIVRKEIGLVSRRMSENKFILGVISDDIVEEILKKADIQKYGAREIQRIVLRNISSPIAKAIVKNKKSGNNKIVLTMDTDNNIRVVDTK